MATRDTIVIGASAGGVQALTKLVAELPADLPAAVFIVLHIPSNAPSLLPSILSRDAHLPVAHAETGEKITSGKVYVAPPDHHLLIEDTHVKLVHGPKENLHRPSIDALFRSAARWAGPRAIGVVLTGARDDGTIGMRTIKQHGGIAIVQDPSEATFPSMPMSVMQKIKVDYPANRHVRIIDGHVNLEFDQNDRPKPSVDILLSSAAQAYGEHLIAVILTGSGSDGAAGAVDVKSARGVVVIQNPRTAPYPSMPLSLPPTAVDHVVEMEQIGPLLFDILKGVVLPSPEKIEDPLRDLLTQVTAQTNIDFRNYKSSTILRRIGRRMAVTHNSNIRDYSDYIRSHPDEIQELVKAFLISVTGFFRDPEAFEFIRLNVIPELVDRGKENGRTLRVWSAGCATGEEAYSLAMLIADHLGPDFPEWNIKVFATDLASEAIAFARRGLYPENVLQDLPEEFRERFFERADHGFRVIKSLRQVVIFGQQDISRGVPFPRIDLVTCRNLLIYLKPELQQIVLDLFAYSLHRSHGYMFLGKAETARPTKSTFELVNKKWKIYRCLAGPLSLPMHESSPATAPDSIWREPRRVPVPAPAVTSALNLTQAELEINQLRRINETMLRYTAVAVIIIDRRYRILTLNAAARRLLGIREIAYDQDFLHTRARTALPGNAHRHRYGVSRTFNPNAE